MTPNSEFVPRLHSRGFRITSQRMAILDVLSRSGAHLTPVQVHGRASRQLPGLTRPTVYRTLEALARTGVVWPFHLENGHLAYELAGRSHHHLVCGSCGDEVEFPGRSLDAIYAKLEASSGYLLHRDHLTLTGLCPKCRRNRTKKKAP
jgi:Fur family ferric uptake transcriptional regulator